MHFYLLCLPEHLTYKKTVLQEISCKGGRKLFLAKTKNKIL